jgi:O-antigen/teichoic acid export membrane protein
MSKAADLAKISVKGSFHYMWGLIVSTVILSVGTIYLASLLSPDEMGLYTLALAAPTLISLFRDWGVNSALVKYTAQYNSDGQLVRARKILKVSLVFEVVVGLVLTVVSVLLSSVFASLYNAPSIAPLIQVASLTILVNALFTIAQSAFTGFERMELNNVTLIVQAVVKVVLISALVLLGYGLIGAMFGYVVSFLVAGVVGTLLLWSFCRGFKDSPSKCSSVSSKTFKRGGADELGVLLRYGLPLSIASIIASLQMQFGTIMMGVVSTKEIVGNYGIAATFVVLITFFSTPVSTMLFPAFSKLDFKRDYEALKSAFHFSVKYGSLLVVPVAFIVMSLSQPAISTLFGAKYAYAPFFLSLLSISYLWCAFGSLSFSNLISSQGDTRFNLYLTVLTAGVGFPLILVLGLMYGVAGVIVAVVTTGVPSLVVGLWWVKKRYRISAEFGPSVKILLVSALAGAAAFVLQRQLGLVSVLELVIGIAAFFAVFVPGIVVTGAINKYDIENLRAMTASLGPIRGLSNWALALIERLLKLTSTFERHNVVSAASESSLDAP